jgi:signal-transduction protein with cAMP-binding, CBS, and nucleotidyltransferase domain
MRKRVRSNVFRGLIENCPIFPKDDPGQIQSIVSKLQIQLIPKDEFIVHRREMVQEMCFILNGEVIMVGEHNSLVAVLTKNMVFGVVALLEKGQFSSTSIVA